MELRTERWNRGAAEFLSPIMVITYFGDGCFRLQSGDTSLLLDPNNNRLKADVTLKTISVTNPDAAPANEIMFPGEYEIKDIRIRGWQVPKESTEKFLKTVYLVQWEEMEFAVLGHLSGALEPEVLEELCEADVLFIPVGGHFFSADSAAKLAKKLEPAAVIPSFAKSPSEFLKALGQKAELEEKFVFKKKDLAGLKGKAVILKAS